jgi:hypothetical protein
VLPVEAGGEDLAKVPDEQQNAKGKQNENLDLERKGKL